MSKKFISDKEYREFLEQIDEDNKERKKKQQQLVSDEQVKKNIESMNFDLEILNVPPKPFDAKLECDHCCGPDFCKHCVDYDRFDFHSSANKDVSLMTGCTLEDVAAWYTHIPSGKYDGWHEDIVRRECAAINRAMFQALEGEDTWFRLQRLIEEDKLSIQDAYSIQLALKKSKALVPHVIDDEGNVSIDINGLAMTADEARGRSGTKNHAKRIRVSAGFVNVKQVSVHKDDEPIDIIRKLEQEEFGELEECFVKVTNIGTNPYTHEQVRTPSRPIEYDIIRVDGQVHEDALKPLREFYGQFDMHKHNYVGTVNKKSDGRCPRTGSYPDPKSPDMMQLYRHQPAIIITPNVKIQETQHTVKFAQRGGLQVDKEISKVERGEDCDGDILIEASYLGHTYKGFIKCRCNVKVKDMRRGEVICPKCGLVFHRDTIVG